MKRRILSILTALCLALSLLPVTAWADGTTIYAGPNTSGTGDGTQANPYANVAEWTIWSSVEDKQSAVQGDS